MVGQLWGTNDACAVANSRVKRRGNWRGVHDSPGSAARPRASHFLGSGSDTMQMVVGEGVGFSEPKKAVRGGVFGHAQSPRQAF